ncbi:MAG TPA: hypothetical protein VFS08_09750 [Gemmatimonadaceae bacterium]|nr:hypothetical protein [Gemmatimonadaceae bacterium]
MTNLHHDHPAARPALAPGRAVRGWTALLLTAVASLSGCYTQVPVAGPPQPGTTLVVDLNDRGRLALGDSIGPSAEQIQGIVEASSDSSYVLRVESVRYLNGQTNRWSGEPLSLRTDLVGRARMRQFSRSRTWAVGLGVAAAVLTFALTTDLFGSGSLGKVHEPPGGGGQQ